MAEINLYHGDCLSAIKDYPDNYWNLAIVDVPYGIGVSNHQNLSRGKKAKPKNYQKSDWDSKAPTQEYFNHLFRVSKSQIIWGANHFIERINKNSSSWIVWDKNNGSNDFSDCELAWTSFKSSVRKFTFTWNGMLQGNMKNKEHRIHLTQKPVALYEWLLMNYAKPGDKILDTHLGSGSIAIACHNLGYDLDGWEIDSDYHAAALKRFKTHIKTNTQIFKPEETYSLKQTDLFNNNID